jgi:hypothetical protein
LVKVTQGVGIMGIRFYCPNGHKVHVKDYQAGQRGLCPTCGIKIQIPWQSTRTSSKEENAHPQEGAVEAPPSPPGPAAPSVAAPAAPQTIQAPAATPVAASAAMPAPPVPPASVPAGGTIDALTEAGDMVWYVRPPSGGQFGPAAADVMRTWLAEGRVSADALVWREGWRDWREAGSVFPQLLPAQIIPGMDAIVSESLAAPVSHRPLSHLSQARRTQATIIGGLVATVVVLFAILLAVLLNQ